MNNQTFSLGTAKYSHREPVAILLASAAWWLLGERNWDGTWGGTDKLDQLISTNHATMALLSLGCAPNSPLIQPALEYLANLDTDTNVNFYWRAGTFLNIEGYEGLVQHDMEYLWSYRARIGAHKDYPAPFFLLKLLRFANPFPRLSFSLKDVLRWVLSEWNAKQCWYDRTSITSMALALIHDMRFKNKDEIVERSRVFLESKFMDTGETGHFSDNLVDDAFLIFNLSERNFLSAPKSEKLAEMV